MGVLERLAERLNQTVPHGEGRVEGDLLRRDRGDERLVGIGRQRRTEASQWVEQRREHRFRRREGGEGIEVEWLPEVTAHRFDEVDVARPDEGPTRSPLHAHLAAADDALEAAFVPEVGEVEPERAVALGGELEVERLRK
jgi:hypothetical protein